MSDDIVSLARSLEGRVIDILWSQWCTLRGEGHIAGEHPVRAIIDPEALVLASLATRHIEARLRDVLAWWIPLGSHLLSVQRFKTLQRSLPGVESGVEWYASRCVQAGDARWRSLLGERSDSEHAREGKGPGALSMIDPSTLWLRLRAGFGVGAKADILAFLIGGSAAHSSRDLWTSSRVLEEATSYSRSSVRRALDDMCLARFVEASADRPPLYSTDARSWAVALQIDQDAAESTLPAWRFWSQTFALLLRASAWSHEASRSDTAPVVQASRARDLYDEFKSVVHWNDFARIDPRANPGPRYRAAFLDWLHDLSRRVPELR